MPTKSEKHTLEWLPKWVDGEIELDAASLRRHVATLVDHARRIQNKLDTIVADLTDPSGTAR